MEHPDQAHLIQLRETLTQRFNQSELQDLCFDMGIMYDELSGSTIGDKARELLLLCIRHNRVAELITHGKRIRPDIPWDIRLGAQPTQQAQDDDSEILETRRFFYEELYRILKPFARYDLPETVTIDTLKHITVAMRDWYFDAGGLYLTDRARGPYFELKEVIKVIVEQQRYQSTTQVSDEDCETLLGAASRLRAALRDDINLS